MRMKAAGFICALLLLSVVQTGMSISVDDEDLNNGGTGITFVNGTWNVTSPRTFFNQTIEINGNITVNTTLELTNVTLIFNNTVEFPYGLYINSSGTLRMTDCQVSSSQGGEYFFHGHPNSDMELNNVFLNGGNPFDSTYGGISTYGNAALVNCRVENSTTCVSALNGSVVSLESTTLKTVGGNLVNGVNTTLMIKDSSLGPGFVNSRNSTITFDGMSLQDVFIDLDNSTLIMNRSQMDSSKIYSISGPVIMDGVEDNGGNISIEYSHHIRIANSTFKDPQSETSIGYSDSITIDNASFLRSPKRGILFYYSQWIEILDSLADGCTSSGFSFHFSGNITMINCVASNNRQGIYMNKVHFSIVENCDVLDNQDYGFSLKEVHDGNLSGNAVNGSAYYDVYVLASTNLGIHNNAFHDIIYTAIMAIQSRGVNITDNSIKDVGAVAGSGIHLFQSNNCWIFNNTLMNTEWGLELGESLSNKVWGNEVTDSLYGIYVHSSTGWLTNENVIRSNFVSGNSIGIYIKRSDHNLILNNTIEWNDEGLKMEDSISEIYWNDLINNTIQGSDDMTNYWDNGPIHGGNFWSDYDGQDLNGDGIGDMAYDLNSTVGAKDRYPLVEPLHSLGVPKWVIGDTVDHDGYYTIDWENVTDADMYQIEEDDQQSMFIPLANFTVNESSLEIKNRTADSYYYRVRGISEDRTGPWSPVLKIEVQWPPKFTYFINLTSTPTGDGLNISFDTSYHSDLEFTLQNNDSGPWTDLYTYSSGSRYYVHSGLTMNKEYFYRIEAYAPRTGKDVHTKIVNGTPMDAVPPAIPGGLTAKVLDTVDVGLNWNAVSDADLAGYNIYRSVAFISGYEKINEDLVTGTNYVDTDIENRRTYYYTVTAVDLRDNESPYSIAEEVEVDLNFAPVVQNLSSLLTIVEDETDFHSINVYDRFVDPDGDILDIEFLSNEHLGVTLLPSGNLTIKPEPNWNGLTFIEIRATDGEFNVTDKVQVSVTGVNDRPNIPVILSPRNNEEFFLDMEVTFSGECTDADLPYGDTLTFAWTSDLDGNLGTGANLTLDSLSEGEHKITLTVTDKDGLDSSYFVILNIKKEKDPPPPISIGDWAVPILFAVGFIILIVVLIGLYIYLTRRAGVGDEVDIEEFEGDSNIEDFSEYDDDEEYDDDDYSPGEDVDDGEEEVDGEYFESGDFYLDGEYEGQWAGDEQESDGNVDFYKKQKAHVAKIEEGRDDYGEVQMDIDDDDDDLGSHLDQVKEDEDLIEDPDSEDHDLDEEAIDDDDLEDQEVEIEDF